MDAAGPSRGTGCSLCERLSYVVEWGELWTLALNLNQNLPGRCVLVLNRHSVDVRDLGPEEWVDLRAWIRRTASALDALLVPDGYNYAFLMNWDAHVHLHVVPRYAGSRELAGHTFSDPHFGGLFGTESVALPPEAMEELRSAIRACLPGPTS